MEKGAKIFVAGHTGMVGSAIVRKLEKEGYANIVTRSHAELDLTDQRQTNEFFALEKPDYVFMCAAKVGGIQANREALDQFLYMNAMIAFNTIMAAYNNQVKKFCFMASSCIYPRECPQPIKEEYLLTAPLEVTNEGYALAKISGLKLCEYLNTHHPDKTSFISVMPCNLYGPGDNYHPEYSHVAPALLRRFDEAKTEGRDQVVMWGTGQALREFLYVDDVADAVCFLMENYTGERNREENLPGISWINIGCGKEIRLAELGKMIAEIVGFRGEIIYDHVHPDGTPRKILDSTRLNNLGWRPGVSLEEGLRKTYRDFLEHKDLYLSGRRNIRGNGL